MATKEIYTPPHWAKRAPVLNAGRTLKMARSAHAYVRGSTLKFYEWLDSQASRSLPVGPPIWICGDCHLSNLGPVADATGDVAIKIRDFDQTVIGNPVHDLIRLGLSLSMSARGSDLPGVTTAHMLEHMVEGYSAAFAGARGRAGVDRPKIVYTALKEAHARSWKHLAEERLEGRVTKLPHGRRFWPLSKKERATIDDLFSSPAIQDLARQLSHRPDSAEVKLVDAAFWMKGCSSLGLLRYAVLLDVEGLASKGRDLCLFDIKEATEPLAPHTRDHLPVDNGERVLEGARQMSPYLGSRMVNAKFDKRSVFVRELLPEDLKLELDHVRASEATKAARYLANVVGRAHARQMSKADRKRWRETLARNHTKSLEAPSWLWSSVVELIGQHERSYLEHCRRYAQESRLAA